MTDELFTVVDLDDPDAVRTAAAQLLQATRDVAEAMDHASGRWSMLENQWVAPESGILNEALLTPQSDAGNLASAGYQAQGTLANFASRLDELADQRRRLLTDIGEFHEDRTDDGDDDDEARGDLIADLQRRCHALAAAKDEAQNICRSALGGIETQASADRGSEHPVPTSSEADDVETAPAFTWGTIGAAFGVTPPETFDNPGVDGALWAASTGMTGLSLASTANHYARTRAAPRQNWAPSFIRNMSGSGGGRRAALVAAVTGWDSRRVTNGGQFLGANDSRNPHRRTPGAIGTLRDVGRRTVANLNPDNRVANPGQGRSVSRWGKVGRVAGPLGSGFTAVTSFADSWQTDSAQRPNMSTTEQTARATTMAATTLGGAAAGAKGGAALGAAVGSVVPGVGTAVGGIVGGLVGGAAGGLIGSGAGEAMKDSIGSAADRAKESVSGAWDGVTSFFGG